MPFKSLNEAFSTYELISLSEVDFEDSNVRSTTETFGVGTLIATPSSLPSSSGITNPTARAAPVDVGIIFIAADLERYKSECIVSRVGWSPV